MRFMSLLLFYGINYVKNLNVHFWKKTEAAILWIQDWIYRHRQADRKSANHYFHFMTEQQIK